MLNYDFNILSPSEFECFTRDLLQASEKMRIESFADGRDGGIDLRFAYDSTKKCIIQCKRYKQDWNKLKSTLNKEVAKVKTLNPDRYILATTIDLTAANKDEIKSMFAPYIKDTTTDILGKADLNNLLGQYSEIEKQYYKLWLGSTNVLDTIVHKNVINWSEFELDEIKSEIAKYVPNESFNQAQKILSENRYVIISGIPGIGKTTLARMLVYNYLAHGYEEFVYVVDDIDNASKVYDKNKKQVFFFDDFLGHTSLVPQSPSFENKLDLFIKKITKSHSSILIMTTRENILSEAKNHYEIIYNIDDANAKKIKCTIDLIHYTKKIRAHILYNHLVDANLPIQYIDALVQKDNYMKLIEYKFFFPSVIDNYFKQQLWKEDSPDKFMSSILEYFDRPLTVWESIFEKLDDFSRYALLVFATFEGLVYYKEWHTAYKYFCEKTNRTYEDVLWHKTVRKLQGFIKTGNDYYGEIVIIPSHPSIWDFCTLFISENETTLTLLQTSVLYPEQIKIFFHNKIKCQVELNDILEKIWINLQSETFTPIKNRHNTKFCLYLMNHFFTFCKSHQGFIESIYNFTDMYNDNIPAPIRFELMRTIKWKKSPIKKKEILLNIGANGKLKAFEWEDYVKTTIKLGEASLLKESSVIYNMQKQLNIEIEQLDNLDDCIKLMDSIDCLYDNVSFIGLRKYVTKKYNILCNEHKVNEIIVFDDLEIPEELNEDDISIHEMFTSLYDTAEE